MSQLFRIRFLPAEAKDIPVKVRHREIARPRHVLKFLCDDCSFGPADVEHFIDVVIDETINTNSKGPITLMLGQEKPQLASLDPDAERQSRREAMLSGVRFRPRFGLCSSSASR